MLKFVFSTFFAFASQV